MAEIKAWSEPDPKPSLLDIAKLEEKLKYAIPDDYRKFLLEVNAFSPIPDVGVWRHKDVTWVSRVTFITWQRGDEGDNFQDALSELLSANIRGYMAIGISSDEDLVLLCCIPGKEGVFLTNNCSDDEYLEYTRPMERVADSFTHFLEVLVPIIPEHCPIRELGLHGTPEQLEEFLAAGNSIETKSIDDMTIIRHAVAGENMSVLERCIQRGANLKGTLCHAVMVRNIPMIHRLIEAGLDLNQDQLDEGEYPLDHVSGCGLPGEEGRRNREVRDLLLRLGATKSKYGYHNKLIRPVE